MFPVNWRHHRISCRSDVDPAGQEAQVATRLRSGRAVHALQLLATWTLMSPPVRAALTRAAPGTFVVTASREHRAPATSHLLNAAG